MQFKFKLNESEESNKYYLIYTEKLSGPRTISVKWIGTNLATGKRSCDKYAFEVYQNFWDDDDLTAIHFVALSGMSPKTIEWLQYFANSNSLRFEEKTVLYKIICEITRTQEYLFSTCSEEIINFANSKGISERQLMNMEQDELDNFIKVNLLPYKATPGRARTGSSNSQRRLQLD